MELASPRLCWMSWRHRHGDTITAKQNKNESKSLLVLGTFHWSNSTVCWQDRETTQSPHSPAAEGKWEAAAVHAPSPPPHLSAYRSASFKQHTHTQVLFLCSTVKTHNNKFPVFSCCCCWFSQCVLDWGNTLIIINCCSVIREGICLFSWNMCRTNEQKDEWLHEMFSFGTGCFSVWDEIKRFCFDFV